MVTLSAAAITVLAYLGATGAVARFNTIPVRAASTGLLLVASPAVLIAAAIDLASIF